MDWPREPISESCHRHCLTSSWRVVGQIFYPSPNQRTSFPRSSVSLLIIISSLSPSPSLPLPLHLESPSSFTFLSIWIISTAFPKLRCQQRLAVLLLKKRLLRWPSHSSNPNSKACAPMSKASLYRVKILQWKSWRGSTPWSQMPRQHHRVYLRWKIPLQWIWKRRNATPREEKSTGYRRFLFARLHRSVRLGTPWQRRSPSTRGSISAVRSWRRSWRKEKGRSGSMIGSLPVSVRSHVRGVGLLGFHGSNQLTFVIFPLGYLNLPLWKGKNRFTAPFAWQAFGSSRVGRWYMRVTVESDVSQALSSEDVLHMSI